MCIRDRDELAARLTDGTQRSQTYDRMDAGQAVSLIEELWKELDVCKKAKGSLEEERKKVIDLSLIHISVTSHSSPGPNLG